MARYDLIHFDLLDNLRLRTRFEPVKQASFVNEQPGLAAAGRRVGDLIDGGFLALSDGVLSVTENGARIVRKARNATVGKPHRVYLAFAVGMMNEP